MAQRRHQAGSSKGGQFAAGSPAARAPGARRPGFNHGGDRHQVEVFGISFPDRTETSSSHRERGPENDALALLRSGEAAAVVRSRLELASAGAAGPRERAEAKAAELGRLFFRGAEAGRGLAREALEAADRYAEMPGDVRHGLLWQQEQEYQRLLDNRRTLEEIDQAGEMGALTACLFTQPLIEHYWDEHFAGDAAGADGKPRTLADMQGVHWGDDHPVNPSSMARAAARAETLQNAPVTA